MEYPDECPVFRVADQHSCIGEIRRHWPDGIVQCTIDRSTFVASGGYDALLRVDADESRNYGFPLRWQVEPMTPAAREMAAHIWGE